MFWRKRKKTKPDPEPNPVRNYRAIAMTDIGSIRPHNEDRILFVRPPDSGQRQLKGYLGIVADGMGGHAAGEIASEMAVKIFSQSYYQSPARPQEAMAAAMLAANEAILKQAQRNRSLQGMGTTCTAVSVLEGTLHIGHIGDSRAYLIKDDQIYQLTKDHTYVQELLNHGKIDPFDALHHPQRNIISQALGTISGRHGDIFTSEMTLDKHDTLLLCSDGLYEYFLPEEIKDIISQNSFQQAAGILIDQAKARGGHDNISVLLIRESEDETGSEHPTEFLTELS